jgi:soluble lytic murein transglycosylase-like protein
LRLLTLAAVVLGVIGLATPARAELVYFTSGKVMSVKGHRLEGEKLILTPRTGGEIVCDASLVARIAPDEVAYPEPAAPPPVADADGPTDGVFQIDRLRSDPRFDALIESASAQHGVDPTLVRAVIQVESAYQLRARSPKGAMGLMQLMPATARQYGVRNVYDAKANIDAGTRHLKSLLDRFPLNLALAAYNAGEGAVERFGGIPPYPETRTYVARILDLIR